MAIEKKDFHPVSVRLPVWLYEKIKKDSTENFRWETQQIVMILTEYYQSKSQAA